MSANDIIKEPKSFGEYMALSEDDKMKLYKQNIGKHLQVDQTQIRYSVEAHFNNLLNRATTK